ncbi:MAG: glycosyltransferase family 1 protein [Patescibacteria group bacterium]
MILGIDAHKLATTEKTGTDEVTFNFFNHLPPQLLSEFDQVILYTKLPIDKYLPAQLGKNIKIKTINLPWFWSSVGLSWQMRFSPPDILFVPSHSLPLVFPAKTATIIHDIGFFDYPQNYSRKQYYHLKKTTALAIKKAALIFTPSYFVKKTLIDKYCADPNKLIVSHLGVDTNFFHSHHSQKTVNSTFKKYDERLAKKPYLLFVGRLDYRKNISNIIAAFTIFKKTTKYPHILVFGGKPGAGYDQFVEQVEQAGLRDEVVFTQYIPKKHLPIFYTEAELLLFPSFYEGFGIPVLEAQACRTPVITANVAAMPEIAGDAALLVNPRDPEEIAFAIKKIIDNPALRQTLVEKGIKNAGQYPWSNFSNNILQALIKLGKKI